MEVNTPEGRDIRASDLRHEMAFVDFGDEAVFLQSLKGAPSGHDCHVIPGGDLPAAKGDEAVVFAVVVALHQHLQDEEGRRHCPQGAILIGVE